MIRHSMKSRRAAVLAILMALPLAACGNTTNYYGVDPAAGTAPVASRGKAKNVILFVGDGMGISTITAARILAGQQQGLDGEEYSLSFEKFPDTALVKTYNTDAQVPDSAGTATALNSGSKTRMGVLNVAPEPARGDCAAAQGHNLPLIAAGWLAAMVL